MKITVKAPEYDGVDLVVDLGLRVLTGWLIASALPTEHVWRLFFGVVLLAA